MQVKTEMYDNCLYVTMMGELDHAAAPRVKEQLDQTIDAMRPKAMIVNLKNLSFMDSTGVGLMMGRYKKLKAINAKTYIQDPSAAADKVFRVSGLYQIIEKIER